MATMILRKECEMGQINLWASPFLEFKLAIARATLDTEEAWRAEISSFSSKADALIAEVVFTKWVRLLGRAL